MFQLFQRFAEPLCFVWDDSCRFCARSKNLAQALDWLHRLHIVGQSEVGDVLPEWVVGYTPEEGSKGLFIRSLGETPKAYYGFFAVRRLVWVLPIAWITLPFWYLPGVSWVGQKVYAWIAANRQKLGGCNGDGSCEAI